jgi:aryl-alcohol dehydrogenase-like predicted oxidoreductase
LQPDLGRFRNVSHNLQAASVRREAEASLMRLGVDTIDLYQIHWLNRKAVGALAELKAERKIRHVGVSISMRRRCSAP